MRAISLTTPLLCVALLSPTLVAGQSSAAEKTPSTYWKLTYRLLQVDAAGKITSAHSFSTIVQANAEGGSNKIRTGDRIPVQESAGQYQYVDVGTNIDSNDAKVEDHQFSARVYVQSSTNVKSATDAYSMPLVRQTNWDSRVVVPIGKPTIVFTSDNLSDTGKTELELTATQIKEP